MREIRLKLFLQWFHWADRMGSEVVHERSWEREIRVLVLTNPARIPEDESDESSDDEESSDAENDDGEDADEDEDDSGDDSDEEDLDTEDTDSKLSSSDGPSTPSGSDSEPELGSSAARDYIHPSSPPAPDSPFARNRSSTLRRTFQPRIPSSALAEAVDLDYIQYSKSLPPTTLSSANTSQPPSSSTRSRKQWAVPNSPSAPSSTISAPPTRLPAPP